MSKGNLTRKGSIIPMLLDFPQDNQQNFRLNHDRHNFIWGTWVKKGKPIQVVNLEASLVMHQMSLILGQFTKTWSMSSIPSPHIENKTGQGGHLFLNRHSRVFTCLWWIAKRISSLCLAVWASRFLRGWCRSHLQRDMSSNMLPMRWRHSPRQSSSCVRMISEVYLW